MSNGRIVYLASTLTGSHSVSVFLNYLVFDLRNAKIYMIILCYIDNT